jgi:uncharacterized protein YndB with AHSA1/START domain
MDDKLTVTRTIPAPAERIFNLLSNPDAHVQLDGSGFVRSAEKPQRISEPGDVFRMNMTGDHMGGDYQTDNTVTGFVPNKLIAWKTAPAGTEPPGWEWMWELTPSGHDSTDVSLTYDWSKVTDKDLLAKVKFPLVSEEQLDDSLARLAAEAES